jgi:hypothetical protein
LVLRSRFDSFGETIETAFIARAKKLALLKPSTRQASFLEAQATGRDQHCVVGTLKLAHAVRHRWSPIRIIATSGEYD